MKKLQTNFNTLLTMLSINVSELSRFSNYDFSYVSRIKNGLRQPANPEKFAWGWGIAGFIVRRYQNDSEKKVIADLIGCKSDKLANPNTYQTLLAEWMMNGTGIPKNCLTGFLEKLDEFNLNEYIRAIHFDEFFNLLALVLINVPLIISPTPFCISSYFCAISLITSLY